MLPLRMASRWWGWANDIALPVWLRGPVLGLFAWAFGCDLEEAQDGELRHYRNLGEFFRRALKPGLRPVCPGDCVVGGPPHLSLSGPSWGARRRRKPPAVQEFYSVWKGLWSS